MTSWIVVSLIGSAFATSVGDQSRPVLPGSVHTSTLHEAVRRISAGDPLDGYDFQLNLIELSPRKRILQFFSLEGLGKINVTLVTDDEFNWTVGAISRRLKPRKTYAKINATAVLARGFAKLWQKTPRDDYLLPVRWRAGVGIADTVVLFVYLPPFADDHPLVFQFTKDGNYIPPPPHGL